MADYGGWHLEFRHMFSISNIEDFQYFIDIFTNNLYIGINFFSQSYLRDKGFINVQHNILIKLQKMSLFLLTSKYLWKNSRLYEFFFKT